MLPLELVRPDHPLHVAQSLHTDCRGGVLVDPFLQPGLVVRGPVVVVVQGDPGVVAQGGGDVQEPAHQDRGASRFSFVPVRLEVRGQRPGPDLVEGTLHAPIVGERSQVTERLPEDGVAPPHGDPSGQGEFSLLLLHRPAIPEGVDDPIRLGSSAGFGAEVQGGARDGPGAGGAGHPLASLRRRRQDGPSGDVRVESAGQGEVHLAPGGELPGPDVHRAAGEVPRLVGREGLGCADGLDEAGGEEVQGHHLPLGLRRGDPGTIQGTCGVAFTQPPDEDVLPLLHRDATHPLDGVGRVAVWTTGHPFRPDGVDHPHRRALLVQGGHHTPPLLLHRHGDARQLHRGGLQRQVHLGDTRRRDLHTGDRLRGVPDHDGPHTHSPGGDVGQDKPPLQPGDGPHLGPLKHDLGPRERAARLGVHHLSHDAAVGLLGSRRKGGKEEKQNRNECRSGEEAGGTHGVAHRGGPGVCHARGPPPGTMK